ncbi:hypothetical protein QBC47DRAFT_371684 [Echria macrotheca]|uniref:Uncharacterized protein n=1 Tax=Echria macrotheca TaxID=438768 RepID=A0AAJ0FFR1_9PEZI|nr:hypothetical protein QBC47DRAFT_371684 [Echria macrotheca]
MMAPSPIAAASSSPMGSTSSSSSATPHVHPRPVVRSRLPGKTLTLVTLAALAATGASFRYVARNMRENELAQKSSGLYVSVDRSGGGI